MVVELDDGSLGVLLMLRVDSGQLIALKKDGEESQSLKLAELER